MDNLAVYGKVVKGELDQIAGSKDFIISTYLLCLLYVAFLLLFAFFTEEVLATLLHLN